METGIVLKSEKVLQNSNISTIQKKGFSNRKRESTPILAFVFGA